MAWADEEFEMAKKLWAEGLSGSQISSRLAAYGRERGWSDKTRMAVIAKLDRAGLVGKRSDRASPRKSQMRGLRGNTKTGAPKIAPAPKAPRTADPNNLPVIPGDYRLVDEERSPSACKLAELEPHQCRWPSEDVQDPAFHFCGREKIEGLPYCEAHARRAFHCFNLKRYRPAPETEDVPVGVASELETTA